MESPGKLYKCYKGTCNKCNDEENPFITEEEYKNLLDVDGKIRCPENHLDCGIQELKPEDYPKPPKNNKKVIMYAGIAVLVLILIVGGILMLTHKSSPKTETPVSPIATTTDSTAKVTQPPSTQPEQKSETKAAAEETVKEAETKPSVKEAAKEIKGKEASTSNVASGQQTKTFSNGDRYVGEMKNGKMNGLGTYYYAQKQQISPKDLKKRLAEAGDYLIGEFYEGNVVSGKLYNSSNSVKEIIMIGR